MKKKQQHNKNMYKESEKQNPRTKNSSQNDNDEEELESKTMLPKDIYKRRSWAIERQRDNFSKSFFFC